MFDLLAVIAADPLSASAWAILLLAGGMYPVGFMLGSTCSPCCQQPCSRCNWYYATNGCADRSPWRDSTVSYQNESHSVSVDSFNPTAWTTTAIVVADVELCVQLSGNPRSEFLLYDNELSMGIQMSWDGAVDIQDDNGCLIGCKGFLGVRYSFFGGGADNYLVLGSGFEYRITGCGNVVAVREETTQSFTLDSNFISLLTPCAESLFEQIRGIAPPVVTLAESCKCGACCEGGGANAIQCVEQVHENSCIPRDGVVSANYLGDDTTCDEPCPSGACCYNGQCYTLANSGECDAFSSMEGTWIGDGTSCVTETCE